MDAPSYVATFASILFGIALTDIAISLHRLLRARARVRFYWLPLLVAAHVAVSLVSTWWAYHDAFQIVRSVAQFMGFVVSMMFLVMLAAACLPDEIPEHLDLETFYFDQHRYFWGLWGTYLGWILVRDGLIMRVLDPRALTFILPSLLVMLLLAWTRRKWVHVLLVPALFVRSLWMWMPWQLH